MPFSVTSRLSPRRDMRPSRPSGLKVDALPEAEVPESQNGTELAAPDLQISLAQISGRETFPRPCLLGHKISSLKANDVFFNSLVRLGEARSMAALLRVQ